MELEKQERLLARKNRKSSFYNGIYDRYEDPVLTRDHAPLHWRYDLDAETNPYFMERLGINAVMNSGAIELDGKFYLVARVEGNDRKSFFAVAESDSGVDGFRFRDYPVVLPDTCPEETNVYDMRLTKHEDGWIYGVFCSESKDTTMPDLSAAVAQAGIVRTKDLKTWERLDNLKTLRSPQQRNVLLHPEFVNGKYAFYTRPMDGFIDTGSGGGIGFGLCDDIEHAVIDEENHYEQKGLPYPDRVQERRGSGSHQREELLDPHRSRSPQYGGGASVCAVCIRHGSERSVQAGGGAVGRVPGASGIRTRGRRVQCGVHQRCNRAGKRGCLHLLRFLRYPDARCYNDGCAAGGLSVPHAEGSASVPGLREAAVRAD